MSADDPTSSDFIPEPTGDGDTFVVGDDLSIPAKDTLASYLSSITTDAMMGNKFPISPNNPRSEFSLVNPDGTPAEFVTGGQDETAGFTDTFPTGDHASEAAVRKFETLSNSGQFEGSSSGLQDIIDKNSQNDGHFLYRDIVSTQENDVPGIGGTSGQTAFDNPAGATPVQHKISSLLGRNRFDPMPTSSPYIEHGEFTEPGIPVEQGAYGVYNQYANRTSIDDMQKVAYSMLMRASGHRMGNQDPVGVAAMAESILPTFVQTGAQEVSTEDIRAENAYHAPDRPSIDNAELRYDDIDGSPLLPQKSVGTLNNPYEKFEFATVPQVLTGVTALAEMAALCTVFGAVMTIIESVASASTIPDPTNPQNMRKGQHRKVVGSAKLLKKLSIPGGLNDDFHTCVCWGVVAFFKMQIAPGDSAAPPPSGLPSPPFPSTPAPLVLAVWFAGLLFPDPIPNFRNMQYSSGYYATILRSIRIDMKQLLNNLIDLVPTSPDPAVILFNLITALNRYRSWRFYCTLAQMGSTFLGMHRREFAIVDSIDDMPNNGQTRQGKSRAAGKMLAWRHRSSPSLILLPQKYSNAFLLYGYRAGYALGNMVKLGDAETNSPSQYWNTKGAPRYPDGSNVSSQRRKVALVASHRLPKEYLDAVEDELDSEYCPFYFHDLRTNEVISFHAFLESLSDSYSVSYAESAGYGRIDPVKIYQNTSRSISLTWTLVATDPEDFDSMWWSVNKLVSMCYPQFSMGKPVKAGNKKFVMPFSQIPTASPVIRLRVGDVIRSNYSRFDLARIFGMSEAIPALPASAGGTSVPAGGVDSAGNDWAGAPFDLTYAAEAEAQQQIAEDEAASEHAATIAAINDAIAEQPVVYDDPNFGYWPGSISDPGSDMRGIAIMKANGEGYTTYDMDADKSNPADPAGYYNSGDWASMFPPPPPTSGDHIESTPFRSRFYYEALVRVLARRVSDSSGNFAGGEINMETDANEDLRDEGIYTEYLVTLSDVDDPADPYGPVTAKGHTHAYVVTSADLSPVYPAPAEAEATTEITLEDQVTDIYNFFNPNNNAIVRSFEAAGGRGLAGVITSFDMDWGEAMWDMRGIGRRAPQFIKCSVSFSPIHDIVPGLDNNGAMRAYNYPVGGIAGGLGQDYYSRGAGRPATGGDRRSSHVQGFENTDTNADTLEGFADSISKGYGSTEGEV